MSDLLDLALASGARTDAQNVVVSAAREYMAAHHSWAESHRLYEGVYIEHVKGRSDPETIDSYEASKLEAQARAIRCHVALADAVRAFEALL